MPTLYIIHGWTYTVEPWAKTIALLEKHGLKVKMLNVPGLTSPSEKVWTIDDYVKWADQSIPDGAIALGHSNGGRILLNLSTKKPGKLKHLILLSAAGVYEPSRKKAVIKAVAKVGRPLKKIPLISKVFHRLTGSTDYAKAPKNMQKTLENMLNSDKTLDLSAAATPTHIIWGKKDTVTPPRQAEKMAASMPNAKLALFDGWTHAPYISHPEELAKVILKLMQRLK